MTIAIGTIYRTKAIEAIPIIEAVTSIAAMVTKIAIVVCGLLFKS